MAELSTTETAGIEAPPEVMPDRTPAFDYATVLGVAGGFVMILLAMILGGSPGAFLDLPALLIVFGGSFLVTSISFSLTEMLRAQTVMARAILYQCEQPDEAARRALYLADYARRRGALALDGLIPEIGRNRFLSGALSLIVDGLPAEQIELMLDRESEAMAARHLRSAGVLRRAGEVAPAMGLIGTLVGLVQMLGHLEDPASVGPAMAVALLTTFYGAVLAHMVFLPVAGKLERNSQTELLVHQIYALGAVSISRHENPRRLQIVLNAVLPPGQRVDYFD